MRYLRYMLIFVPIAVIAEFLVGVVEPVAQSFGVRELFPGAMLLGLYIIAGFGFFYL